MMLLTVKQVAERLNCSESFVYNIARAGKLTGLRMEGMWRFSPSAVDDYIEKSTHAPTELQKPLTKRPSLSRLPMLAAAAKKRGIKL